MAVLIAGNASTVDRISTVSYGGGTLARVATIPGGAGSEPGRSYLYFRGTVVAASGTVNVVASVAHTFTCWSVGLTGAGSELIVAGTATVTSTSLANPSGTVSVTPAAAGVALGILFSGANAPASNAYNSGYTAIDHAGAQGEDFGSQSANAAWGNIASPVSSFALGWTNSTADDVALIAALVKATTEFAQGVRATATATARAGSVSVFEPVLLPDVNRALEAV
jgi:hypothetical protein